MYVCPSVSLLTFLPKFNKGISPDLDKISFWYFLKIFLRHWYTSSKYFWSFWTHSLDVYNLVPNNSKFLSWNSNIPVLPGLNLLHLYTIVSLVGHLLIPLVLFELLSATWNHMHSDFLIAAIMIKLLVGDSIMSPCVLVTRAILGLGLELRNNLGHLGNQGLQMLKRKL